MPERVHEPSAEAEARCSGHDGSELRPEEDARGNEKRVLEIVDRLVPQSEVVKGGNVPEQQVDVEATKAPTGVVRAEQPRERPRRPRAHEPRASGRRTRSGRPSQSGIQGAPSTKSGGADEQQQHVLGHVRPEQLVGGSRRTGLESATTIAARPR